jgi:hypothetical protein
MVSVTALQLVLKRVSEAPQIHNLIRSHPAVIRAARANLLRLAYRHLSSKPDEHRESYTWMDPPSEFSRLAYRLSDWSQPLVGIKLAHFYPVWTLVPVQYGQISV